MIPRRYFAAVPILRYFFFVLHQSLPSPRLIYSLARLSLSSIPVYDWNVSAQEFLSYFDVCNLNFVIDRILSCLKKVSIYFKHLLFILL